MAYNVVGTKSLSVNSFTQNVPMTMSCWCRATQSASVWQDFVVIGNPGGGQYSSGLAFNNAGKLTAYTYGVGGFFQSISAASYTQNTWHHCAGVFPSTATRTGYLDGVASAAAAGTSTITPTRLTIGVWITLSGDRLTGDIADVGVWSAALSESEIQSLARGVSCRRIRPQSLVFYAPLVRDLVDVRGGLTITNNNSATVAAHPRVYA